MHPLVAMTAASIVAVAGTVHADLTTNNERPFELDVLGGYASDHLMVQFVKGKLPAGDAAAKTGDLLVDAVLAKYGVKSITPIFAFPFGDPDLAAQIGLDRWYNLNVPTGTNVRNMMLELRAFKATFDHVDMDGIGGIAGVPNDPEFVKCWGQNNTGQSTPCGGTGTAGADVNAPQAWDFWSGSDNITLAVIDSGVTAHVDFAGKMVPGWDTVNNQGVNLDDSACPHGTHCAGTAAALGNNGVGVAGMSWGAKIMPVRVLTGCSGVEQDCAEGIVWAADNGAHVGTMSLRYFSGPAVFEQATEYAHTKGMVLIAANGNDFPGPIQWPAKFPLVTAAAATTITDGKAGFSSIGPESDVAAPGQDVWSTIGANSYSCLSGTSMATPHVSGLACLLWSYNPNLTNDQVVQALKDNARDLGEPGWDTSFGWGIIDAAKTLEMNPPGLMVQMAAPVPALAAPGLALSLDVKISVGPDTLVAGTEKLTYRVNGGSFTTIPLVHVSGEMYKANLPAFDCGDAPEFYVQAEGKESGVRTSPFGAPEKLHAYEIGTIKSDVAFDEGFNTPNLPAGWTGTGLWHVSSFCSPNASCDGGSFAYYGQDSKCNYDTGAKTEGKLTTPTVNLTQGGSLEFCYRYDGEGGDPYDKASVLLDGKEIWMAKDTQLNWTKVKLEFASGGSPNAKIEFVFNSLDSVNNKMLGFQIDGVKAVASTVVCDASCYADCDGSGSLDIDDFICFQTLFALGDPYGDCDGDSNLTIDDFICFQTSFAIGC